MSEDQIAQDREEAEGVKTCPRCRGTWPAGRSHCLACGASLADVPARPPPEDPHAVTINWRVLDALSPESSRGEPGQAEPPPAKSKGRWWEFWR
jgi:hypothetical protein